MLQVFNRLEALYQNEGEAGLIKELNSFSRSLLIDICGIDEAVLGEFGHKVEKETLVNTIAEWVICG